MITGERILLDTHPGDLAAGQYMRWHEDLKWYAVPPGGSSPVTLEFANYEIEEHQDRTITVHSPIQGWSLTRGVWNEA